MSESKEIANWKKDMQAAAVKTQQTESAEGNYISLKGGIMTYQDEPIKDNRIECIVVAASFARTCFMRPYDPDDNDPPECFANALDAKDLVPHENVPQPFADVCNETACEWAKFGSALQGNGPRCKTRRKLWIIPVSALGNIAEGEAAVIVTPPTSSKNYSNYANKIASQAGVPPWAVKTMIKCSPHPKKQFEITFELTGLIENEKDLAAIHARIPEAESAVLQPYTYEGVGEDKAEEKKDAKY